MNGLAFQFADNEAKCTKTSEIRFDNVVTDNPYNCTATDPNKKCQIVYDNAGSLTDTGSFDVLCKCSMGD